MRHLIRRIRKDLSNPCSKNRQIAASLISIGIFVLVGKAAGAGREVAVAWRYGVSETVDAYVFIFNFVTWPVAICFSILNAVLVPLVIKLRQENSSELRRFQGELFGLILILGVFLAVVAWIGLPQLLLASGLNLSADALTNAHSMIVGLSLIIPIGLLISLYSVWMMTSGWHRNTLLEGVPALTIVVALLIPPKFVSCPLVLGTIAGLILQLVILCFLLNRAGEIHTPRLGLYSPAWKAVWGSIGILAVGQALTSSTTMIDQFFAAGLAPGDLSSLNYANRIVALVMGIGAMAISRATLPIFAEARAHGAGSNIELALKWTRWMFTLGAALSVVFIAIAPHIVQIMFERGEFNPQNTNDVTLIVRFSIFQIPFYFAGLVLVSFLAANGLYGTIALSGVLNFIVKLSAVFVLLGDFGILGIVMSAVLMYAVSFCTLYWLVHRSKLQVNV